MTDGHMQDIGASIRCHVHYLRQGLLSAIRSEFSMPDLPLSDVLLEALMAATLTMPHEHDVDPEEYDYKSMRDEYLAEMSKAMPAIRYVVTSRYSPEGIAEIAAAPSRPHDTVVLRWCEEKGLDPSELPDEKEVIMDDFDLLGMDQADRDILYVFRLVIGRG